MRVRGDGQWEARRSEGEAGSERSNIGTWKPLMSTTRLPQAFRSNALLCTLNVRLHHRPLQYSPKCPVERRRVRTQCSNNAYTSYKRKANIESVFKKPHSCNKEVKAAACSILSCSTIYHRFDSCIILRQLYRSSPSDWRRQIHNRPLAGHRSRDRWRRPDNWSIQNRWLQP